MTLTSEQLSVVNLASGRHLVLAPPGSGKTEMLSQRIVRALGSGVDCERHYFKTNFRATPLLLEILMRFSLDALRSEWEFLPVPSDATRANGEVSLSPSGSPKAILEKARHLLGGGVAENVAKSPCAVLAAEAAQARIRCDCAAARTPG